LREADTLVVWKLDRLGRSAKGLVDLVNELEAQKVRFQSITDGIDHENARRGASSFMSWRALPKWSAS
jgi:DNA invertase Pin-like site-specific DNA recombinase